MKIKIKIAIADDHPLIINGLCNILGNCADMEIVGSYTNGDELLKGISQVQPDILLLDIQMPGKTGDELAEIISNQYPQIKMIALTNQDNVYYIKTMLRKGVSGYILKTTGEEILLEAIRSVNRGEQYLETALKEKIALYTLNTKKETFAKPVFSRREIEVLGYIAANLTSQQIADKLNVSKRTIDSIRTNLLLKLDVKNTAALVKKGIQMGLIN